MTSRTPHRSSARTADDRRIVRCASSADFLAALPQLTGFTADDSVFVVLFTGKRAENAIRFDLPADDDPRETLTLLDVMSDIVGRTATALGDTSPAVVITSSRSFAECGGAPSRAFARQLKRRLARDGLRLRDLCCVGSDAWVSLLDPGAPRLGRPLSEIRESPISLEAAVHGRPAPDLAELGRLPEPDPSVTRDVSALLDRLALPGPAAPLPQSGPGTPSDTTGPIGAETGAVGAETKSGIREMFPGVESSADIEAMSRILDTALLAEDLVAQAGASDQLPGPETDDEAVPSQVLAEFIVTAQDHHRWAMIALTLVSRPWFLCNLAAEFGPASFFLLPIEMGSGSPPGPGGSERPTHLSVSDLIGNLPSDARARERLKAVLPALSLACASAPEHYRAPLLTLRAWVWWMHGLHSIASADLDRAHEDDPDSNLVSMMRQLVDTRIASRVHEEAAEPLPGIL